jgi:acyl-CoA synthetase (AMP-forming)/AMP-acid ligase II
VVLRDGAAASEEALIEHVKRKLGRYKAPKSIKFVRELPMSPVGKLLRRKVRDGYWRNRDRHIG